MHSLHFKFGLSRVASRPFKVYKLQKCLLCLEIKKLNALFLVYGIGQCVG